MTLFQLPDTYSLVVHAALCAVHEAMCVEGMPHTVIYVNRPHTPGSAEGLGSFVGV